ncbi:hypothetical protein IF655_01005 [Streptomyces sp. DSM 110735]|uniref:hypothetical protein n=1 Tax=Streptomyces sp. DSM 110735 TaxID=2775031 RepID=UPI0018F3470D|nr:hypothetical protein [Streptomyces sp. DSM 110735]MBJ7901880.1 hypothetical protein [Streptomyces sp. DSM 110735]
MYATACAIGFPQPVARLVQHARVRYGKDISSRTASAFLYRDPRFCWAGDRRYGLYRHGLLPGPRTLEQAARLTLLAAAAPLPVTTVASWLRGLGYAFRERSFRVCVHRSPWTERLRDGRVRICPDASERDLLRDLVLGPEAGEAFWQVLRQDTAERLVAVTGRANGHGPDGDTLSTWRVVGHSPDWSAC